MAEMQGRHKPTINKIYSDVYIKLESVQGERMCTVYHTENKETDAINRVFYIQ